MGNKLANLKYLSEARLANKQWGKSSSDSQMMTVRFSYILVIKAEQRAERGKKLSTDRQL